MNKISLFFKSINQNGIIFIEKIKKSLDEYSSELEKFKLSTSTSIAYNEFKDSAENFIKNFKKTLDYFNNDLYEPLNIFMNELNKNNLKFISELSNLSSELTENKFQLEKLKYNYFISSKSTMEQEKKIKNLSLNPNTKENNLKNQIDILVNYQYNSSNSEQNYKDELKILNKKLNESEDKYQYIIDNLKTEESSRLHYFINILNKFSQTLADYKDNINCYIEKLDKITQNINIKRDLKIFDNLIVYKKDKNRFPNESFLNYNIYKKSELNIDEKNLNKDEFISLETSEKILGAETFNNFDSLEIIQLQNKEILTKDLILEKNIEKLLKGKEPLTNDELIYVINKIELKENDSMIFLKYLSNYYKNNSFVNIKCLDNLYHLSNFLSILINNTQTFKSISYFNFIIIYIAEKTIYLDPKNTFNKFYLSKILSKNKILSEINFWKELIEKKIIRIADIKVKREIIKKNKLNDEIGINDKLKSFFGEEKLKENKLIEDKIIYEQLYEKNLSNFAIEILEDYIQHFSNFNFEISDSTEIIVELSSKYKFDTSYVNYFVSKLNSNMFTVKNKDFDNIEKKIDYQNLFFNINYFKHKNVNDSKLKIILKILQFINIKEIPNLLTLNKTYNKKLEKFIYKNILLKYHNMSIKNHLKIWKILLKYNKIKGKYNYKKIIEEIKNNPDSIETKDVIKLDVMRTLFLKDVELNREKIENILKAVAKESPNITYCQGMNYIAAFLLNITNDEEDSFYIFLSLLFSTEYGQLFINDLERLKKYFYVFERLINIFLPELYFYFIHNNINVSFFCSSWFITLFTNAFQYNTNMENPKIFLRIWDLFIFSGWKSIIKIGIAIIKHFEPKLLSLTDEGLLHFLLNDIIKSGFFENENFDTLMFITINFKIEGGLISNIENEYDIKNKIPSFGNKKFIDTY